VRIASEDFSVFAGTGLGLIGINYKVAGSLFGGDFGHERVFEA
jgi:hypothetical protein